MQDKRDDLQRAWDAFKGNMNWVTPHPNDDARLYEFFSLVHLHGVHVGEDLIIEYFGEREEDDPRYHDYIRLVKRADIAGELLAAYDRIRTKRAPQ